ncbi:hypothetical protein AB0C04_05365 [Micromonospora sp. NPDC048909]|uniref:hypothetical protein n=1 Tax=Micromonospora sp. NPDC048909 TaxID=3155643 RepID=UPI0033F89991
MKTLRLTVVALLAGVALTACGAADDAGTPTSTSTGAPPVTEQPATPATSPTPATPPAPSTSPTRPPKSPGGPTLPPPVGATTLTGTIAPGVEPGCLLLDGYLLVGGPRNVLTAGAKVTVSGRVEPNMMTTCQQGTPFVVESAQRA